DRADAAHAGRERPAGGAHADLRLASAAGLGVCRQRPYRRRYGVFRRAGALAAPAVPRLDERAGARRRRADKTLSGGAVPGVLATLGMADTVRLGPYDRTDLSAVPRGRLGRHRLSARAYGRGRLYRRRR